MLTPAENLIKRLWFTRDHLAMARMLGWGEVAPFYIDLEAPVPASGVPKPGPLEVHLKDDHMQYAITWFGLAGRGGDRVRGVVAGAAAGLGVRSNRLFSPGGVTRVIDSHIAHWLCVNQ